MANELPNYMTDKRGIEVKTTRVNPNDPTTFTVSEEDAARLRAMAMNNSSEDLSPEIKAALGMNDDYDQKIPKNIHNQICYDEARRNNIKYQEEAKEFTDNLVKDNATKEILDEGSADEHLNNFDFGDITEYLTKLDSLSFLEAVSYKKKIDAEIARWKSCKSMLKAITDLKLDDKTNRELMKLNTMEDYDFTQTVEEFESTYEENLGKLNQISAKLVSIVNAHKDEMDSTRFLTDEMIHLMEGKINRLDPDGMNYKYNKTRMEIVLNAFKNRRDLSFLSSKFDNYLKSNKINILRDFKDNASNINSGKSTSVINELIKSFSNDIMYGVYSKLMDAFNYDTNAVYLMMGFLAKIMNSERKSARDVWVKVFALNLADSYNNIFDIDILSDGEVSYITKIHNEFYPKINAFFKVNKLPVKLNSNVTFGLTSSKKTKEEDTETEKEASTEESNPARGLTTPYAYEEVTLSPEDEACVW